MREDHIRVRSRPRGSRRKRSLIVAEGVGKEPVLEVEHLDGGQTIAGKQGGAAPGFGFALVRRR